MDYERARASFEAYLDGFDRSDPKVKLKIVHTYGVVSWATRVARRMGLSREDTDLARLIALLHDIGRFEPVKRFDSFEPATMDHASYGVELLQADEKRLLRSFIEEEDFDEIILSSIATHSLYELPPLSEERIWLHSRLIRDADKLDNCRVKLVDSLDILLGMETDQVGLLPISERVWEYCLEERAVYSPVRQNRMDYWVSYIAYFFDINFPASAACILEEDFVRRVMERIPYGNPDTARRMQELREMVEAYLRRLIGEEGKEGKG